MDIRKILEKMTLEDKVQFCTGANFWKTKEMKDYGIGSIMVSDGPHGLRCQGEQSDNLGLNNSYPSTCFPTAVSAADSWNEELINEVGEGEYIVEGSVKLDDLNDAIGTDLQSDDYDSVGGYMIGLLDRIPRAGEKVTDASGNTLEAMGISKNRIDRIHIILNKEESDS